MFKGEGSPATSSVVGVTWVLFMAGSILVGLATHDYSTAGKGVLGLVSFGVGFYFGRS